MFDICVSIEGLPMEESRIDLLIEVSPFHLLLYVFQPQTIIHGCLNSLWEEESKIIGLDGRIMVNYSLL